MIDLSKFILVRSDKTKCPECDQYVYLLIERDLEESRPLVYFLCLCGAIRQAGNPEVIASRENGNR